MPKKLTLKRNHVYKEASRTPVTLKKKKDSYLQQVGQLYRPDNSSKYKNVMERTCFHSDCRKASNYVSLTEIKKYNMERTFLKT